ncbi:MAG: hypothetical protein IJX64_02415 [Clostridia bacterium]|nr:hypothetical protein [Clostridia bacterium]
MQIRKITAIPMLLALFMLFSFAAAAEDAAPDAGKHLFFAEYTVEETEDAEAPVDYASAYVWGDDTRYFDQLTEMQKEMYTIIETAFANGTVKAICVGGSEIVRWDVGEIYTETFPIDTTQAEFSSWAGGISSSMQKAYTAFLFEHPEYFWVRSGYSYSAGADYVDGELRAYVYMTTPVQPACNTQAKIDAFGVQIDKVVEQLLDDTKDMPVVARLAYWDNWLAAENDYNTPAASSSTYIKSDETPWSIISGFLPGYEPVCEGYAKAFSLLCNKIGVPCVQISGSGHRWTAVRLDGKWYVADPTWDDPNYPDGSSKNFSTRNYFLVSQPTNYTPSSEILQSPEISDTGYFADGFVRSSTEITGGEVVLGGTVLIALYDENDRMLDVGTCLTLPWGAGKQMCLAPAFSSALLQKTATAARFVLDDSWSPVWYEKDTF